MPLRRRCTLLPSGPGRAEATGSCALTVCHILKGQKPSEWADGSDCGLCRSAAPAAFLSVSARWRVVAVRGGYQTQSLSLLAARQRRYNALHTSFSSTLQNTRVPWEWRDHWARMQHGASACTALRHCDRHTVAVPASRVQQRRRGRVVCSARPDSPYEPLEKAIRVSVGVCLSFCVTRGRRREAPSLLCICRRRRCRRHRCLPAKLRWQLVSSCR